MTNVILLTIDSIRYDYFTGANSHLSPNSITPNIDAWAKDAFQFPLVFSPGPSTGLTFPALLSGSYSSSFREKYGLSKKRKMLAEYMRESGYATCAFNSNPYLTAAFNYNRGFDYFFDDFIFQGTKPVHYLLKKLHLRFRSIFKEPYWTAPLMNEAIMSWLSDHKDKPFFLWAHYMDVHGPYISKKGMPFVSRLKANILWQKATRTPKKITENEKRILIETYIEEIEAFDREMKVLLSNLPADSIVIITGDHGEFLGERNEYAHSGLLYNTLLHVPLLVKMPDRKPLDTDLHTPLSTLDIVPTILEYLNLPKSDIVDGRSFFSILDKGETVPPARIISEEGSYHMSVIDYPWKLIANYRTANYELYNLVDDPNENNNLRVKEKERFARLNGVLEEHRQKMNIRREGIDDEGSDKISKNEELVRRMRQLGYMK